MEGESQQGYINYSNVTSISHIVYKQQGQLKNKATPMYLPSQLIAAEIKPLLMFWK